MQNEVKHLRHKSMNANINEVVQQHKLFMCLSVVIIQTDFYLCKTNGVLYGSKLL